MLQRPCGGSNIIAPVFPRHGLRVIPPNQFTSKLVPYPIGACSTRQVFMQAGVVQKQQ